jgi:Subtilase family
MAQHPHLIVRTEPTSSDFTSPSSGPRTTFSRPPRTRAEHAQALIGKIEDIEPIAQERVATQREEGITEGNGIYLTFESEPMFELKFESLDVARSGIELCAVKTLPDVRTQATIFVPDGKLEYFLNKIQDYRDKQPKPKKEGGTVRPSNQDLVESITDIRLAALEGLWVEEGVPFPQGNEARTWEVWLRKIGTIDHLARLRAFAPHFNLTVGQQFITFVDRTIVHVQGTAADLARSVDILGMIAELHAPKTTAAFFTDLDGKDQAEWVQELADRIVPPSADAPYVCLFDTGVSHPHPLLVKVINAADRHTYKPAWGVNDSENHGTPMAGLASFGDLTGLLESMDPVPTTHRLETVKIIHDPDPHQPDLYGAVTQESTYRVEVIPDRKRVFCMAVTAPDGRARGKPSSWSAAVDALASGANDDQRRLFILSAGNTDLGQRQNYPNSNMTDAIHDPAQAWNAVTVGGYTDKAIVDATKHPGWLPLAAAGDLSPSSCTSTTWGSRWPIKPDIVLEAGNMAKNPAFPAPDYIDDGLLLLSTNRNTVAGNLLTSFRDTSAATALAAQLAGMAWAKYPTLTPESVRALLIHSATWTPVMEARFRHADGSLDYKNLSRCFGYGIPNKQKLLSSLDNSLTLLAEDEIKPFYKDEDEHRVKTRELRLHALPWPTEALRELHTTKVTMRVTLSYFVEPSPGERGWSARYGYQSHGLRFAVKKPLESLSDFEQRINRAAREEYVAANLRDPGWRFGSKERSFTSLGSIHSDMWEGQAVELAERGHIAVYPTMGWWNKRQQLNGWTKSTRYSLLVTIETPEVEADIYTPVAIQIGIPIVVET